jgi:hypothetical protein
MDYQKVAIAILCAIPTIYEAFSDRYGERKKDKLTDGIILVGYSVLLTMTAHWLGYRPVPVIVLILATRFAFFDYLVHYFLKRYSESHKNINIWSYMGNTTHFWDQAVSKVDWRLRIAVRLCVFALAVLYYTI